MLGLDRLSPTNSSVHGRMRQSVREDDVRVVREKENVQMLYESVRVSGANEVRVPEKLMDVGDGLMNVRTYVNLNEHTPHAEVHAVSVGRRIDGH